MELHSHSHHSINLDHECSWEEMTLFIYVAVCCSLCKYESVSYQHIQEFNLDINNAASVPIAFNNEFKTENIESYKCIKCHKYVKASKSMLLEKLPKVVTIQLRRYSDVNILRMYNCIFYWYMDVNSTIFLAGSCTLEKKLINL